MNKKVVRSAMSVLVVGGMLSFGSVALAGGNVDFFLGQKEVDTDFGGGRDMEEQDAYGIFTDWGGDTWPVHIAFDVMWGNQDVNDDTLQTRIEGSTTEIDVGVRWYPAAKESHWMPHLGGGLGLIGGEVTGDPNNVLDDNKLGVWADAGLAYRIGAHFRLGGRVRYSLAKLDNVSPSGTTEEVDAGGLAYGVNLGFTW